MSHGSAGFSRSAGFSGRTGGFSRGGSFSRGGGFSRGGNFGGLRYGNGYRGSYGYHGGYGYRGYRNGHGYHRFGYPYAYWGYGWPYAWGLDYWDPFFWGDSYAPDYSYSYAPTYSQPYDDYGAPPQVVIVSNQAPAPEPPPAPNMTFIGPPAPTMADQSRSSEPLLFLIAFNDHNIKPALAYWTEDGNLKYVTMDHQIKTVPLKTVDRDMSLRLNQERRVTFTLPRAS